MPICLCHQKFPKKWARFRACPRALLRIPALCPYAPIFSNRQMPVFPSPARYPSLICAHLFKNKDKGAVAILKQLVHAVCQSRRFRVAEYKRGKKEEKFFFVFFWENGRLLAEKSLFIHYRMQIYLNYQNDCFDQIYRNTKMEFIF